jgi:SHS2 domain-containing protein
MKSIQQLFHIADIRLVIKADTQTELFEAGLEAMAEILRKGGCKDISVLPLHERLEVSSLDLTALLIDFLSEVLLFSHTNKAVFCNLVVEQMNETSIIGTIHGKPVDEFDDDIKAVTYHEANVQRNSLNQYVAKIAFEV